MSGRKIKSLVIPAGSAMAVLSIKALKQDKGIVVLAADVNDLAPGLFLAHKSFLMPPFDDKAFFSRLEKLIRQEHVDVIIPALDTILLAFSEKAKSLEQMGTHVLISEPETIRVTRDKWQTYLYLKDKLPVAKSFDKKEGINVDYPIFIKPRTGSGSKQAYIVRSDEELAFFYNYVKNPIIQEYLPGTEYTTDCLADMQGNLIACVPRRRLEIRDGVSTKGRIEENPELRKMAQTLAKVLKFKGPFFFQAKEDRYGKPKLIEINARIAGTMCPSSFAEGNFHTTAVRLAIGEKIAPPKIRYGIFLSRYWEEIYLDENEIRLRTDRTFVNTPTPRLRPE